MAISGYIDTGAQQLHYHRYGNGGRLLLAFHGYSNTASLFEGLAGRLAGEFTTLSVDLPHHGKSEWKGDSPWRKEELGGMVASFMRHFGVSRVSLAGFSLGGRVCLAIMELMPEAVERAVLLAPDGLVSNPLYWFVTRQPVGKRLFQRFLEQPQKYIRFADWLLGRKLINAFRHRFFLQYVSSPAARNFLRQVWPGMRLLVPDRRKVRAGVRRYHIPLHIFMGRYDRIIPPAQARSFAAGIPEIEVHVLDKGHRLIDPETLSLVAECLIHP